MIVFYPLINLYHRYHNLQEVINATFLHERATHKNHAPSTNLICTGAVTEVGREIWLCRVKMGGLETNRINSLALHAGNSHTWWKPSVSELVVLFSLGQSGDCFCFACNLFKPGSSSARLLEWQCHGVPGRQLVEHEPKIGRWCVQSIKPMLIEAADNLTSKVNPIHCRNRRWPAYNFGSAVGLLWIKVEHALSLLIFFRLYSFVVWMR